MPADLASQSGTLPSLPDWFVPRDHIISTLDRLLETDPVALLQGPSGAGKRCILASFALAGRERCISLFLNSTRASYDAASVVVELWRQARQLDASAPDVPRGDGAADLSALLARIGHKARRGVRLVILVDGLDRVAKLDPLAAKEIVQLLPLGNPGYRFVFSGHVEPLLAAAKIVARDLYIFELSETEARQMFAGLLVDEDGVDRLRRRCNGLPGHLAVCRRLIAAGTSVEAIIAKQPGELANIIRLEWDENAAAIARCERALAIVAFDHRDHAVGSLATILAVDESQLSADLNAIPFLLTTDAGEVQYASETFKDFAKTRLSGVKEATYDALVQHYLASDPSTGASVGLPYLLHDAKRQQQLLAMFEPEHFQRVVQHTKTLSTGTQHSRLAIATAYQIGDDATLFRLSVTSSSLLQLIRLDDKRAEVAACVAIDDLDAALDIARAAMLKEERLALLASVLAGMAAAGIQPDEGLLSELRNAAGAVDVELVADDLLDIAADVFAVAPGVAIELVDKYSKIPDRVQSLDWALAALLIRAKARVQQGAELSTFSSTLSNRIADPKIRSISHGFTLISPNSSAEWILDRASEVEDKVSRLTVLRAWLDINEDTPGAASVAAHALDLAIKTSEYTITARTLRQLSACVAYAPITDSLRSFVRDIQAQIDTLTNRAPTIEYVRAQATVAVVQRHWEPDPAIARLESAFELVRSLTDPAVRAECLCYLRPASLVMGANGSQWANDLDAAYAEALRNSADHSTVCAPILSALLPHEPALAFSLVDRINTDYRRDEVRATLLRVASEAPLVGFDDAQLVAELGRVSASSLRNKTLLAMLATFAASDDSAVRQRAVKYWTIAETVDEAETCAEIWLQMSLAAAVTPGEPLKAAYAKFEHALESVQDVGRRRASALLAVRDVARMSKPLARGLMTRVQSIGQAALGEAATEVCVGMLRLTARVIAALASNGREASNELDRLTSEIQRIGDVPTRCWLAGEAAVWLQRNDRPDLAAKIFDAVAMPSLEEIRPSRAGLVVSLVGCGAALFARHQGRFLAEVRALEKSEREEVVRAVVRTIVHGVPPAEPAGGGPTGHAPLSANDVIDVLTLVGEVADDVTTFSVVRAVVESILDKRTNITATQAAAFKLQLDDIVMSRLPAPGKIQHEGFRLAAAAQVQRLEKAQRQDWRVLAHDARQVPNEPDAALTMALCASAMPAREETLRRQLVTEAAARVSAVSVDSERAAGLMNVADVVASVARKGAADMLKAAASICAVPDAVRDREGKERQLLDVAYRVDPELAQAIASDLDKDPARSRARQRRHERKRVIELQRTGGSAEGPRKEDSGAILDSAAAKKLGALHAGSEGPPRLSEIREWLRLAAGQPLVDVTSVFAFYLESACLRLKQSEQGGVTLRRLADGALAVAVLARSLFAEERRRPVEAHRDQWRGSVRAGGRADVLSLIRGWSFEKLGHYLKISDPYFGPDELEFVKVVAQANPDCEIHVLTSRNHLDQILQGLDWQEAFSERWRQLSTDPAPRVKIVVAGMAKTGRSPLHERWWITSGSALEFGTSLNAVGVTQESKVEEKSGAEAAELEEILDKYLRAEATVSREGRVRYEMFHLE